MKTCRLLSVALAFVMLLSLISCARAHRGATSSYSDETGEYTFVSFGDGTCLLSKFTVADNTATLVGIPQKSPDGDTVVEIGGSALFRAVQSSARPSFPQALNT